MDVASSRLTLQPHITPLLKLGGMPLLTERLKSGARTNPKLHPTATVVIAASSTEDGQHRRHLLQARGYDMGTLVCRIYDKINAEN